MFDIKEFYRKENEKIQESYEKTLSTIRNILNKTEAYPEDGEKKDYYHFFRVTAQFILKLADCERALSPEYFTSKSFDALLQENRELYHELFPENYSTSYANPSYCVNVFGDGMGQLLPFFYNYYRKYISFAYTHKIFEMEQYNKLFIEVYRYIRDEEEIDYSKLKELITNLEFKDKTRHFFYLFNEEFNPAYRFYTDIIEKDELSDLRYLFKLGNYISDNEIRMARFMRNYSDESISALAKAIVKAYFKGFERDNKDISKKTTVAFYCKIGMEKLYREVIREFRAKKLETSMYYVYSTDVNKQYSFDHKFDPALYFGETSVESAISSFGKGIAQNKDHLAAFSGWMFFNFFGEIPFKPKDKPENLALSEEQTKLYQIVNMKYNEEVNKYAPPEETSFSAIGFPSPEIGEKFEEIFAATVEINMLDSDKYERIQQHIIDKLDQADFVHVKGRGDNSTDLIVKLQELKNPEKETLFTNSGASVNIPAGELFTSPQLKGTNGILHVEETYHNSLSFLNLKLTFKDGLIEDYSCTNFDSEEQNRKYIKENLLFPHETLPMGEFAIGTNTLAYVVAKKYAIMNVLSILIKEKTAPHFAIGDTCYKRSEDQTRYNKFTKKVIVAKDNEKSLLRKTEKKDEAYFNKHNDIVLPFDSIDFITAVTKDGTRFDIIRDGKFVLKGTEELNIPLLEYEKEKN